MPTDIHSDVYKCNQKITNIIMHHKAGEIWSCWLSICLCRADWGRALDLYQRLSRMLPNTKTGKCKKNRKRRGEERGREGGRVFTAAVKQFPLIGDFGCTPSSLGKLTNNMAALRHERGMMMHLWKRINSFNMIKAKKSAKELTLYLTSSRETLCHTCTDEMSLRWVSPGKNGSQVHQINPPPCAYTGTPPEACSVGCPAGVIVQTYAKLVSLLS